DGVLICCNNLAKVSMQDWREQVLRCATKTGRPVREWQEMLPAGDFRSQDNQPPLKTLILQL
ncbi:SAM-dependent methyltransferase, partial [Pseudomonas syringae pv. actinidiae ICMP 18804]